MANKPGSSRIPVEQRVERVEELMLSGVAPSRIEVALSKEYSLSRRQIRNYITEVYRRWRERREADAPLRRERVFLMGERFYTKTMAEKKYGPAAQILGLLMKASGAFEQRNEGQERLVAELGPPPLEPTAILVWTQRALALALHDVITNPALDPERKLRWMSELGGKLGMTHAKVLIESKLALIEAHAGLDGPPQVLPTTPAPTPPAAPEPDGTRDS